MDPQAVLTGSMVIFAAPRAMTEHLLARYRRGQCRALREDVGPALREQNVSGLLLSLFADGASPEDSLIEVVRLVGAIYAEAKEEDSGIILATSGDDIRLAKEQGNVAILLSVQDSEILADSPNILHAFYQMGVRLFRLDGGAARVRQAELAAKLNMVLDYDLPPEISPPYCPFLVSVTAAAEDGSLESELRRAVAQGGIVRLRVPEAFAGSAVQAARWLYDLAGQAGHRKICLEANFPSRLTPLQVVTELTAMGMPPEEIRDIFGLNILRVLDRILI